MSRDCVHRGARMRDVVESASLAAMIEDAGDVREFAVPIHLEDLELIKADRYYVQKTLPINSLLDEERVDEDALLHILRELEIVLVEQQKPWKITQPEQFDVLYSCIKKFERLPPACQLRVISVLCCVVSDIVLTLTDASMGAAAYYTTEQSNLLRNGYKMATYLLYSVILILNQIHAKEEKDIVRKATEKKKQTTAKKDLRSPSISLTEQIEKIVEVLLSSMCKESFGLWKMSLPEEEFVLLFTKTAFELFSNQVMMRSKVLKPLLYKLVASTIERVPSVTISVASSLFQLVLKYEHLAVPIADLLQAFNQNPQSKQAVSEMISEIGRMKDRDFFRDTSGSKNIGLFLSHLAIQIPKVLLANISLLLPLLDTDSYYVRSAVVNTITQIIISEFPNRRLLTQGSEDAMATTAEPTASSSTVRDTSDTSADAVNKTRDTLLNILQERVHDVNSFARGNTLKCWILLCEKGVVPLSHLHSVTSIAVDRLHDKTVNVRKNAMQLLTTLLEFNPFMGDLDKKPYQEKATELREAISLYKLEALALTDSNSNCSKDVDTPDAHDDDDDSEKDSDVNEDEDDDEVESDAESTASSTPPFETDINDIDQEIQIKTKMLEFYDSAVAFITQFEQAIPTVCELLNSRSAGDIIEALHFFTKAYTFRIPSASIGVRKMLILIWNAEESVRQEVVTTFRELFICVPGTNGSKQQPASQIAKNLVKLIDGASLAVHTSLEELMSLLMQSDRLPTSAINALWTLFSQENDLTLSRGALCVLGMVVKASPKLLLSPTRLETLAKYGLGSRVRTGQDWITLKYVCIVLQQLTSEIVQQMKPSSLLVLDMVTRSLQSFLCLEWEQGEGKGQGGGQGGQGQQNKHWYAAAEQALAVIFVVEPHPEDLCADILKALSRRTLEKAPLDSKSNPDFGSKADMNVHVHVDAKVNVDASGGTTLLPIHNNGHESYPMTCSATDLSKLMFLVGDVAVKTLVHTEKIGLLAKKKKLSRGRSVAQDDGTQETDEKNGNHASEEKDVKKTNNNNSNNNSNSNSNNTMEDELGLAAEVEAAEDAFLAHVTQKELVGRDLLGVYGPILLRIVADEAHLFGHAADLKQSAILSLCKFMCISPAFCEKSLQLLFTKLKESKVPSVRGNIIIALGDLSFRFPNLIEPWTSHLYARLRDEDAMVRKNTLMVLTHLILNDMVKVKGQVFEIALSLLDAESRIQELARLFFHELSKRGNNPIYNLLPDTISQLSLSANVSKKSFREITKFLISFIQKERQIETLVEKLCSRFAKCSTNEQMEDIAYCLQCLTFIEKTIKKLIDCKHLYRSYLTNDYIFEQFRSILSKTRKLAKSEMKELLEDFERQLEVMHSGANEELASRDALVPALNQLELGKQSGSEKRRKSRPRSKNTASKKLIKESSDEEENEEENEDEDEEENVEDDTTDEE